jgi:membrane fusion protein (multidrug efflux system)
MNRPELLTRLLVSITIITVCGTAGAAEVKLSTLGCMFSPSERVQVSSPVPGVLETVSVRRGARVARGDVLFQLKAGVEQASVDLARVKADFSERKAARNEALYLDDILTVHERDEIETEVLIARSELNLREQELALRTVFSPIDGVVVNRMNNEGEYVDVDPVMQLATLNPLHVDLLLPSSYFGKIKLGQKVKVRPDSIKNSARIASVSIVDPLIDPASGTFRVQLEMENPGNALPAGLRCNASLIK